jgi:hypothetical protein
MKEKIIEILNNNTKQEDVDGIYTAPVTNPFQSAKEISTHVMEFIEWIGLNTMTDRISRHKIKYMTSDMDSPAVWLTLSELYEYWLKNVKDATN